jgi:hypothetical protein
MQYYVQQAGKKFGPYIEKDIIALRDAGKINRSTLLSPDKVNWTNASEFDWLYPPPKGQESKSGSSSSGVSGKTAGDAYSEYRSEGAAPSSGWKFSLLSLKAGTLTTKLITKAVSLVVLIVVVFVAYKAVMYYLPEIKKIDVQQIKDDTQKVVNEYKDVLKNDNTKK